MSMLPPARSARWGPGDRLTSTIRLVPARLYERVTLLDKALVSLAVLTLFLERFEKDWYEAGLVPIPDIFFVLVVSAIAVRVALGLRGQAASWTPTQKEAALVAFVALLGVISIVAITTRGETLAHAGQVAKTYSHILFLLFATLALGRLLARGRLVEWALQSYFVLAVLVSAVTITQAIDQNLLSLGFADLFDLRARRHAEIFARPMATFSEPAYLAYATFVGAVVGATLIAGRRPKLGYGGAVLCVVAFLLSGSVGAIAVVAALLTIVAVRFILSSPSRSSSRAVAIGFASAFVVVFATLALVSPVRDTLARRVDSIASGQDPSAELRKQQNRGSIEIWKMAPLTGVGLGNTRLYLLQYIDVEYDPGTGALFAGANAYLGLLGEVGPLGALGLVGVLFVLIGRNAGVEGRVEGLTRLFMTMVFLQFLVLGTFVLPPFWFWASLRVALERRGLELQSERRATP
jgi:O-antigen ligase